MTVTHVIFTQLLGRQDLAPMALADAWEFYGRNPGCELTAILFDTDGGESERTSAFAGERVWDASRKLHILKTIQLANRRICATNPNAQARR